MSQALIHYVDSTFLTSKLFLIDIVCALSKEGPLIQNHTDLMLSSIYLSILFIDSISHFGCLGDLSEVLRKMYIKIWKNEKLPYT